MSEFFRSQPRHVPPHVEPPDPCDLARDERQRRDDDAAAERLCVTCDHFRGDPEEKYQVSQCRHESNMRFSVVIGHKTVHLDAAYLRKYFKSTDGTVLCGPDGRFWKERK